MIMYKIYFVLISRTIIFKQLLQYFYTYDIIKKGSSCFKISKIPVPLQKKKISTSMTFEVFEMVDVNIVVGFPYLSVTRFKH